MPARDRRRTRVGAPRCRANGGETRPGGRRVHRIGLRGGRHPAGPGQSRRRLLRGEVRPHGRRGRGAGDRGRIHQGLPLAVHPLGRPAPALRQGAYRPDHRKPGPADPGGARHASMIQPELSRPPKQRRPIMVAQTKIAEPTVVNGINLDDLFALIEGVKRDAAKSKTNWRVTTTWQGQTRSRAQLEGFGIGGERVSRRFSIDIDEPSELGGTNRFANPQEHLLAALNACMMVGYVAQCAVRGITLESLEIETDGEIDLRGFLGIDPNVPPGYENLSYIVRIKGSGTKEEFAEVHEAVMATSPNFYNVSRPVALKPTLVVE